MKISAFKTDRQRENEGVWVAIGDGARVKVARFNNERYKQTFLEVSKPYKVQVRTGTLQEEVAQGILRDCFARAILLDWEGLQDDEGNDIPYSEEAAKELLAIPDFMSMIEDFANSRELYRREAQEQAGNS
jgi:hypothetical protein